MAGLNTQGNYTPFYPFRDLLILAIKTVNGADDDDLDDTMGDCNELLMREERGLLGKDNDDRFVQGVVGLTYMKQIVQIDYATIAQVMDEEGLNWEQDWSDEYDNPVPFLINFYAVALIYLAWASPLATTGIQFVTKIADINEE